MPVSAAVDRIASQRAPVALRAAAADRQRQPVAGGGGEQLGDLGLVTRGDDRGVVLLG
jgi:hypothetical protein